MISGVTPSIQNIRVVTGITGTGEARVLYCGFNAVAAKVARDEAGPEFEVVGVSAYGIAPQMPRYPRKEFVKAKSVEPSAPLKVTIESKQLPSRMKKTTQAASVNP